MKFIYHSKPWYLWNISFNPNITWDIIKSNPAIPWITNYLYFNKLTAQAKLSMAKHKLKANQKSNYLARYIRYELIVTSLEYGY